MISSIVLFNSSFIIFTHSSASSYNMKWSFADTSKSSKTLLTTIILTYMNTFIFQDSVNTFIRTVINCNMVFFKHFIISISADFKPIQMGYCILKKDLN